jgi:haloalkane dehalogenase
VDEGDGPPVVMLHGQPTWSYLFRKVMPPLIEAGYRCVVPDLPGFGRSDKPLDEDWYSIERHTEAIASLVEELDLHDATFLMHDWGGPLGLRVATAFAPERVARLVVMDSVLTGEQDLGEYWRNFRDLVAARPHLPVGRIVRLGCRHRPPREITDAYDAPFPDGRSQAGVRAFPDLIPFTPDAPEIGAIHDLVDALCVDTRPALLYWAEHDPIFPREQFAAQLTDLLPSAGGHLEVVEDAGHFLLEDQGERIGAAVAAWLDSSS